MPASHDPMIASKAFAQTTSENWCHLSGCGRWAVKVGYIRTSKEDQNPDLQRKDFLAFGCEKVFEEQMSSRKEDRPVLRAAMNYCREGDELVVWKLYRFGRSLRELIDLVNRLREQGVEFVSLRESIDTTTPGGKLVFHVFGAVAEFEKDLILERTMAGLEAARARGRKGGRKPAMDERKIALVAKLMRGRETPISETERGSSVRQPSATLAGCISSRLLAPSFSKQPVFSAWFHSTF